VRSLGLRDDDRRDPPSFSALAGHRQGIHGDGGRPGSAASPLRSRASKGARGRFSWTTTRLRPPR